MPKSNLLWWIAPSLFVGLWLGGRIIWHETLIRDGFINPWFLACVAMIVFAVGLWFEQKWARWLGLAIIVAWAIYATARLAMAGISTDRLIAAAASYLSLWYLWREPIGVSDDEEDEGPFLSLVLLLREPQYLEASMLAELATKAWGVQITGGSGDEDDSLDDSNGNEGFIVGDSPLFICRSQDAFLLVHNFSVPYFDDPEAVAEDMQEMRASDAIRKHQAWIGVDFGPGWEEDPPDVRMERAYRLIARLLAELADDNCMAVVDPDAGQIFVYDPETEQKLRSLNPLVALRQTYFAPVVRIEGDDKAMEAAVEEARRRWPEFVQAFESREVEESPFLVKAPFTDEGETEYMWVEVSGLENDMIYGTLGNIPANLSRWREGDRVQVKVEDLNDWVCVVDGEPAGGFTIKVLGNRTQEE